VIAYRTILEDTQREGDPDVYGMLLEGKIDVATFTSPSAIRNFAKIHGADQVADLLKNTVVATIGPVTADAARQLAINVTVQPKTYTFPRSSTPSPRITLNTPGSKRRAPDCGNLQFFRSRSGSAATEARRILSATIALQARITRAIDLAHAAGAERSGGFVRADPRSGAQSHRGRFCHQTPVITQKFWQHRRARIARMPRKHANPGRHGACSGTATMSRCPGAIT
jgi:hypothetical protein